MEFEEVERADQVPGRASGLALPRGGRSLHFRGRALMLTYSGNSALFEALIPRDKTDSLKQARHGRRESLEFAAVSTVAAPHLVNLDRCGPGLLRLGLPDERPTLRPAAAEDPS